MSTVMRTSQVGKVPEEWFYLLHSLTESFFNILKVTASSQGLGTYVDDDDDANDDTQSGDLPVCVCVYIYIYTHTHTHTYTHILIGEPR